MSSPTYWNLSSNEFVTSMLRPVCLPINAPITAQMRKRTAFAECQMKLLCNMYWLWLLPWDGKPSCARIRVQCSEMFMMTSRCNETVTDGMMDEMTITLLSIASASGANADILLESTWKRGRNKLKCTEYYIPALQHMKFKFSNNNLYMRLFSQAPTRLFFTMRTPYSCQTVWLSKCDIELRSVVSTSNIHTVLPTSPKIIFKILIR